MHPSQDKDSTGRDELVRHSAELDDVELRQYAGPWPTLGTRAERRARRHVLTWMGISIISGLALVAVYLFWPWRYVPPQQPGSALHQLYTPMLGLTSGLTVLGFTVALIVHIKRFLPHEQSVQRRHDHGGEGSTDTSRNTLVATVTDAAERSGVARRSLFRRTAGLGAAVLGAGAGVVALGGFVRDPWDSGRGEDTLWRTPWRSHNGEKVYLRAVGDDPHTIVLVRPGELEAGSMMPVVPFRESERGHPELLAEAMHRADSPAMLFRLRPDVVVERRPDRRGMNFDDYYAYSRICTHLGCPVSLFEQQIDLLLCPCHQSQFDLGKHAEPVFGPAVRALPQLPIDVDDDGYFVARGDFTAPVGPGFWELEP
ncbi:ubiquinol-cytochrome c reductase iron-sulfur subunit [Lentzea sp. NEAU-D7]|uniref:cytochrome bc1 complex Rieske iron-sulfur subunit n=1 Tax=Lentzea sp. NEAU-D7 TaxID=2994667 RepID=UPI00224B3B42|nr:ubiquinol-cytochrome c reductase iron-sulfur subunit [Lentzea sp. NEAU-D7]MCX2948856.1 ubiquinol-cytochrome c reductase iron-sulfur subunit [Lentzea sp. NEAU-D7]